MALRLLPFRQYNEHDVVNLYALDKTITDSIDPEQVLKGLNDTNDNGVLVKINSASLIGTDGNPFEPVKYGTNDYLGKTDYPHIGSNQYPFAQMTITPAPDNEENILGVTLNQTLTHDENGEKLLYYRQKALEMQAVLPGEVVPVLTRGIITLAASAFKDLTANAATVGADVFAAADGQFDFAGTVRVGKCLAVGDRDAIGKADYFAGEPTTGDGTYVVVKLEL